jgi:predicted ABC-type ATPase
LPTDGKNMSKATVVWGRFNPPTEEGHGRVVHGAMEHAEKTGGTHYIFPTHTQDSRSNPLSHGDKVHALRKLFPKANVVSHPKIRTIIHAMQHMEKQGHTHVTVHAGSDRVGEYQELLNKYRAKEFPKIKKIEVKSAGHRDPDAEGEEGESASKHRALVAAGKRDEFISKYSDPKLGAHIHDKVKAGMSKLKESYKAIFLVGGPGSGKDFLIHSVFNEHNLIELSLDKLNKAILEQKNLLELEDHPSVIINGTAENKEKIIVSKAILEAMGYDTAMVFVYTSDEVSRNRNNFRLTKGSKTFNEEVRSQRYQTSVANMNLFFEQFKTFFIYDNSENIIIAEETRKSEIAGWLRELSEGVERFLDEKVLEAGADDAANFIKHLTPGQVTNDVKDYSQAEKIADEDKKKGVRRKEQSPLEGYSGDARGGGIAVARSAEPTIGEEENKKPKKKKLKDLTPVSVAKSGMSSYFDGRMGAVPTGGIGLTSTAVQEETK